MAGKFSLLTTLTLNATGYNDGINKAKAKTKEFGQAVDNSLKGVKGSFQGLTSNISDNITGGLNPALTQGLASIRGLIGGVNSLKAALIATGIGAIIVGLGTAFYSLNSYMTKTKEGAERSKEAFAVIKGAGIELQNRVNTLGRSLFNLFAGDFKAFASDFKNAFNSDFIASAIAKGAEAQVLAQEQNKLKNEKLALDKEELDVQLQQSELTKKAKDYTKESNYSAAQRLKFEQEAVRIGDEFDAKKLDFLQRNYDWIKKTNSLKDMVSDDDNQAEIDAYKQLTDFRIKDNQDAISENKIIAKNQKEIDSDAIEAAKARIELEKQVATERLRGLNINSDSMNFKNRGADKLNKPSKLTIDKKGLEDLDKFNAAIYQSATHQQYLLDSGKSGWQQIKEQITSTAYLTESFGTAINGLTDAFAGLFEGAEGGFKNVVTSMLQGIQTIINALLAEAIAGMITGEAKKGVLGLLTASIGTAALIGLWKSKVPAFETGGILGGNSFTGDKLLFKGNSGEMILNKQQQANLFALANNGAGVGGGNEVVFRIEGNTLVGVLNNYNRKVNNIR